MRHPGFRVKRVIHLSHTHSSHTWALYGLANCSAYSLLACTGCPGSRLGSADADVSAEPLSLLLGTSAGVFAASLGSENLPLGRLLDLGWPAPRITLCILLKNQGILYTPDLLLTSCFWLMRDAKIKYNSNGIAPMQDLVILSQQ